MRIIHFLNESELDLKNQLTDDQRAELKELTGEKLKTAEDEFTQARDNKIQALNRRVLINCRFFFYFMIFLPIHYSVTNS